MRVPSATALWHDEGLNDEDAAVRSAARTRERSPHFAQHEERDDDRASGRAGRGGVDAPSDGRLLVADGIFADANFAEDDWDSEVETL